MKDQHQSIHCGFLLWLRKIMIIFNFTVCIFLFFSNKYKLLLPYEQIITFKI